MALPSATRLPSALLRARPSLAPVPRNLSTAVQSTTNPKGPGTEKRFVRIAGPSSHATRTDLEYFLSKHGIDSCSTTPQGSRISNLVQGQADIFQNQSIWIYDAGSSDAAANAAALLSGRVAGMKLVRAAAVDERLVDEMLATPQQAKGRRMTLRRRMNIIKPDEHERGRTLLATNLPNNMAPRFLWSFFASYDVVDIRHLRRSGVACIVFDSASEAFRAMRERTNLPIQGNKQQVVLRLHE